MSPERTPSRTSAAPHAAWPSPISTSDVARSRIYLGSPTLSGDEVWWSEDRPADGGRTTIMHRTADGSRRELLPAPWSARSRVHEYGGRSYAVVPGTGVVFANHADQRLYLLAGDEPPLPLTPDPERHAGLRYADLRVHGGDVWAVRERHHDDGKVDRAIVSVSLDPASGREPVERAAGGDFYAYPTISPDGEHLAYITWNHPRMPWQGTELRVTRLSDGHSWTVKGGQSESVLAPRWRDDRNLYVVSDWSGWWNLYQIGIYGTSSQALYPAEEEFAGALWRLGDSPYEVLGDGRLAVLHGLGDLRLGVLDPETGSLTDLDVPYDGWTPSLDADGVTLTGIAYGAAVPGSVVRVNTVTGRVEGLRRDVEELPDIAYLPQARAVEIESRFGRRVHAIVYPPANPAAHGDGPPPFVVSVHGGPTAHAVRALELERAFFTSRGIGIIDVNYGGSTGYGRAYRERLRGQWGVIDVEDTIAAAEWLAAEGIADPARIAVRGNSAGGWTVLAACCSSTAFAGGVSYYGVSALAPLNATTHDFESRYVEWLVGPEDPVLYATREPLARVAGVSCPMLLLQGLDDPVVPPVQSEAFASALAERGVPCTYLTFEGESHGFRRAETRSAALAAELAFYQQIF
ncbi:prolyl oligopeptidase family serine peptidase [Spongiactinospora sp. TRM90649]|uniref:S9 family peptidase n=1 Tax=Spongiactinospora sp. TRM90649 TaxID=3031114 RepID=UPI0023F671F8|nr:prolyl oligopeptidase family serine peptidase [Spongiactinospora sp. TRM90649]MDF5754057.1 prolyl oligopeptidase family serine peptidase [Spongiactinospora sp. TRM90649]